MFVVAVASHHRFLPLRYLFVIADPLAISTLASRRLGRGGRSLLMPFNFWRTSRSGGLVKRH